MKKTLLYFIAIITLGIGNSSFAQTASPTDTLSKRAEGVYFELLGPGGFYSVNYDTRLSKRQDGWGIRGGISYTAVEDASLFTLPVQVNYLLGKNEKFFELGLGATYATAGLDWGDENETGSKVFGTMAFGYRKQPADGGFMFRGGASPVFGKGFFWPYYGYLSFGYSF